MAPSPAGRPTGWRGRWACLCSDWRAPMSVSSSRDFACDSCLVVFWLMTTSAAGPMRGRHGLPARSVLKKSKPVIQNVRVLLSLHTPVRPCELIKDLDLVNCIISNTRAILKAGHKGGADDERQAIGHGIAGRGWFRMCTADGRVFGSVAEALRLANATMDYLNSPEAADLDAAACGTVLRSLGEVRAKFTAAHASVLSRFDAADAHDSDGYGNSAAWLMAMTDMTRGDAKTKVRRMRLLRGQPAMAGALADADISKSQARAIAEWTRKLPAELRAETITILVQAARAGASLDDLRMIAGVALERWRASRPDADEDGFDDRYVQAGTTFGGAGVIRGNLTPECAAAVQAVLEALGKKADSADTRTEGQRFHDALQQGCELLIGAKMVPDRAGADTHVLVHIPFPQLRQHPDAAAAEDVWLRGAVGEPGYLTGKDAEAAGCDAVGVPVVTGHADMRVVDKIIAMALAAAGITLDGMDPGTAGDNTGDPGDSDHHGAGDSGDGHQGWG